MAGVAGRCGVLVIVILASVLLRSAPSPGDDSPPVNRKILNEPDAGGAPGAGTCDVRQAQRSGSRTPQAEFTAPAVHRVGTIHLILIVADDGSPALTRYQRVVMTVEPAQN